MYAHCKSAGEITGLKFHSQKVESNEAAGPVSWLDWHSATVIQRAINTLVRVVLTLWH